MPLLIAMYWACHFRVVRRKQNRYLLNLPRFTIHQSHGVERLEEVCKLW